MGTTQLSLPCGETVAICKVSSLQYCVGINDTVRLQLEISSRMISLLGGLVIPSLEGDTVGRNPFRAAIPKPKGFHSIPLQIPKNTYVWKPNRMSRFPYEYQHTFWVSE